MQLDGVDGERDGVPAGLGICHGADLLQLPRQPERGAVLGGLECHRLDDLAHSRGGAGLERAASGEHQRDGSRRAGSANGCNLDAISEDRGLEFGGG